VRADVDALCRIRIRLDRGKSEPAVSTAKPAPPGTPTKKPGSTPVAPAGASAS
jgi:hypothetical protein